MELLSSHAPLWLLSLRDVRRIVAELALKSCDWPDDSLDTRRVVNQPSPKSVRLRRGLDDAEMVLSVDLIIASGYPYPHRNVSEELAASKANSWFPVTVDFRATAARSGASEAATFDELLSVIAKKKKGSIRELGLIGHANQDTFV